MPNFRFMDQLNKTVDFLPLLPVHETLILGWRNSENVAPYMYSDHLITQEEHNYWFESARIDTPKFLHRLICANGEPVGLVSITSINYETRSCAWAFYIASKNARGSGVGLITEWWAISQAFDGLDLNRIECEVLVANTKVIQMHESFGFRRESYLRERCWKSGIPLDAVGMSLLKSDWQLIRPTIAQKPRIAAYIN
jgi:UDP-4-amino-4,6-dideoxy-N-acetyl-beta-L-altrosamine N-acetyltransferase